MKIDKNILNAAKLTACRELFIKYQGKSHKRIEAEMRELGFHDFSRRILYKRTGRGGRPGWIAEFGWNNDWTASVPLATGAAGIPACEATTGSASILACEAGSSGLTPRGETNLLEGEQPNAGGTGVASKDARRSSPGDDFEEFQTWLKRVSPKMTWDWRHQIYLYEKLKRVTSGECKRLMIFMPPRHGKSELVTVRYTAWRMRRTPEMKVILASYGQDLANTFSRGIKRVICEDLAHEQVAELQEVTELQSSESPKGARAQRPLNSGTLQNSATLQTPVSMFPFSSQRPINTAAQWGTAVGGGLRAVGVGGGVTGFGADMIVIDDPVKNRAEAESERFRERVWAWYNDDLYTRLEPNGSIILIQTRWHEDDLAGRLLKQMEEGGEEWEVVDLPAIAELGSGRVEEKGSGGERASDETGNAETGARASCRPESEPGAIATGFSKVVVEPAEDADPGSNETVRKAGLPPQISAAKEAGASPPSGLSIVEVVKESKAYKPKVIGFPRLYSHLNDDATGAASIPACEAGSPGLTPRGEIELGDRDVDNAGGTGVASRDACRSSRVGRRDACGPVSGGQDARAPAPLLLHSSTPHLVKDPLGRSPGDALLPERYPVPKLNEIRSQLGIYGFSALYQQHPTPADGAIFKKSWLRNVVESAPPGLRWFRGYDLAISTKTTADYTASFRVALDDMGIMYIADGFRERLEYPEQRRFILERIRTERNTRHGIEDTVHGKSIIQELRREMRYLSFAFQGVPVVGDKLTRALNWSPRAEEGRLKLVRGPWIDAFVHELIRFPMAKHDDQVDAVSIAVQMMSETPDRKMYKF